MMDVFNAVPPGASVPEGLLVFPVPAVVGWLIVVACLVAACALLALVTTRGPVWPHVRQSVISARRRWPRQGRRQPSSPQKAPA
jgi:hypothetical protein